MLLTLAHIAAVLFCGLHILLRRHRQPESRMAWLVVLVAVPYLGTLAYLLLGATNIGRTRIARLKDSAQLLPPPSSAPGWDAPNCKPTRSADHDGLFRVGRSISGYSPVGGNHARLMADSDAMIASLVQDIEQARDTVHLLFYIWLPDNNGTRVAEALERAARRGVICRAMVDDIGSRDFIKGPLWSRLEAAGIKLRRALPVGNPLIRMVNGRIDLRFLPDYPRPSRLTGATGAMQALDAHDLDKPPILYALPCPSTAFKPVALRSKPQPSAGWRMNMTQRVE